ncbi:lymphocyte antigen 6 family member pge isoform X1 [Stigmatopora nigra]
METRLDLGGTKCFYPRHRVGVAHPIEVQYIAVVLAGVTTVTRPIPLRFSLALTVARGDAPRMGPVGEDGALAVLRVCPVAAVVTSERSHEGDTVSDRRLILHHLQMCSVRRLSPSSGTLVRPCWRIPGLHCFQSRPRHRTTTSPKQGNCTTPNCWENTIGIKRDIRSSEATFWKDTIPKSWDAVFKSQLTAC